MIDKGKKITIRSGFTVLELMVAVAVTALLATALLTISSQVLETQRLASEDLETNQVAQFVLDQYRKTCNVHFTKTMAMFGWQFAYLIQKKIASRGSA